MKGVILAGGTGSRLHPLTMGVNKHLLPVYDKPMIYYPLSTLMMAGCTDVAVVTSPESENAFRGLLGDGSRWGIRITYLQQNHPGGIAHALESTVDWADSQAQWVILGDNIFFGRGVGTSLSSMEVEEGHCVCFSVRTSEPERFGIVDMHNGRPTRIIEKPNKSQTTSNLALTGLYRFPARWNASLERVKHSSRGEQEITDVLMSFLQRSKLTVKHIPRGTLWMDAGTTESLHEVSKFVASLIETTGQNFGSPEEVSLSIGLIDRTQLTGLLDAMPSSIYKAYISGFRSA